MKLKLKIQGIFEGLIGYFLSNSANKSYTVRQRAYAFVILNLSGFLLNFCYILAILITNSPSGLIVNYITFIILSINLILIKRTNFKFSGNFFTLSLILLFIINVHLTSTGVYFNPFYDEFYFLLAFLILSILFATDLILVINAMLIILGTLSYYYIHVDQYSAELQNSAKDAIMNFEFAVFMITVVLLTTSRIIQNNIRYADKQAKLAEEEKDNAINAFSSVAMTSDTMHEMSSVINDLSLNLNSSTIKQASNITEMSSTIEMLNESLIKNAEYAGEAARSSGERTMVVRRSERLLKRVISSIRDISSRISFIQDVARQTNILSLNAAIEASRAGQSGRGFSAVANGIKKLADQSQTSARDIISLVNEGLKVSDQANDYLSAIVENSEKSTELMTKISEALMDQINNITQINIGMSEISNAAKNNAEIVDNLATNVEIMKQNAEIQRDLFQESSKNFQI